MAAKISALLALIVLLEASQAALAARRLLDEGARAVGCRTAVATSVPTPSSHTHAVLHPVQTLEAMAMAMAMETATNKEDRQRWRARTTHGLQAAGRMAQGCSHAAR